MEINNLWKEYKEGKEKKEKIIIHYSNLVKLIAGKMMSRVPASVEYEDLVQNGMIGLIEAVDRFDVDKQIKFETYALRRIRGAILDYLRGQDFFSRSVRNKLNNLERTYQELESELGRFPDEEELAKALHLNKEELQRLIGEVSPLTFLSLNEMRGEESSSLAEMVEDKESPDPSQIVEYEEMKKNLIDSLKNLTNIQRQVLALYYYEDLTLKEISKVLELSESRICQIHCQAILKLRAKLKGKKENFL